MSLKEVRRAKTAKETEIKKEGYCKMRGLIIYNLHEITF
jgi:hypothetical protein